MDILALLYRMVTIMVTIGAGFLAGKLRIIEKDMSQKLSRLVICITNPALILYSVLGPEHLLSNQQVLILTAIAVGCYAFMLFTSRLIPLVLRVPLSEAKRAGMYEFMYIFSNIGYMGYPVVAALFGDSAIFYATIFVIPFNVICFSRGTYIASGRERSKKITIRTFMQPIISVAVLSYILYLSNVRVPPIISDAIGYVGNLTSPLALLILGSTLSRIPISSVFCDIRLYGLSVVKLLIMPILTFIVINLMLDDEVLCGITVVMMAMPAAINATMLALEHNGDYETASAGVFLTTIVSLITIPFIMWLLF